MQSSIAILLRAGVLLGCLAGLPLMAAGGVGSLDKFLAEAQGWWQRHQHSIPLNAPRTIQVELPAEALQYRDFTPFDENPEISDKTMEPGSGNVRQSEAMAVRHVENSELPRWPRGADTFSQHDIQLVSITAEPNTADTPLVHPAMRSSQRVENTFPSHSTARMLSASEIGQSLRQQGAIEVKLEPWGRSGQLYRYQALMAIGGARDVECHFQAIDANPDLAAQNVLHQVNAWLNR